MEGSDIQNMHGTLTPKCNRAQALEVWRRQHWNANDTKNKHTRKPTKGDEPMMENQSVMHGPFVV